MPDTRRSPRGERGLKYLAARRHADESRRSPRGERGLKSSSHSRARSNSHVAPHAGSVD